VWLDRGELEKVASMEERGDFDRDGDGRKRRHDHRDDSATILATSAAEEEGPSSAISRRVSESNWHGAPRQSLCSAPAATRVLVIEQTKGVQTWSWQLWPTT